MRTAIAAVLFFASAWCAWAQESTSQPIPTLGKTGLATSCGYSVNENDGTVVFQYGCAPEMMGKIIDDAKRSRRVNAGDIEAMNKRLDRIIELLEKR